MEIRHLEYFIEVARCKSFTKAAEQVHVSQPSISKMIKDIENRLGVELFYRNTKHVELTDAGETFLEQAQQIVSLFQNINTQIDGITGVQKGKIRIGFPPITSVTIFSHLLGAFKKEYPNTRIYLYEFGSKKIEEGIQEGELDIGIVCLPLTDAKLYDLFWLTRDPLRVVMHPKHWLARNSVIGLKDLAEESFVLYREDFRLHDQIIERCIAEGFQPNVIFETSQLEFMTQIVAANLGIAFLPSKICSQLDPDKAISLPLIDPQIYLQLGVVWKKGRYLSYAARQWIQFARDFSGFKEMNISVTNIDGEIC
jgi:DNA-binding transcriptional LysR family regulator